MRDASEGDPEAPARPGVLHRISRVPTPAIFIGAVLFGAILLWREGAAGEVRSAIRGAHVWLLIAGLLLYLLGLAILCLRWELLVRMVRGVSQLPKASEAFLTSVVINYAAPIGLAVPSRAALTKRALGLTGSETGAVALWEVACDVLILAIGSMIWLAAGGWDSRLLPSVSGQSIVIVVAIGSAIAIGLTGGLVVFLRGQAERRRKLASTLREIAAFPRQRPRAAAITLAVTAIYWIEQILVMWILLEALNADPTMLLTLGLISLPLLIGMLSPVPGGAGVREAVMLGVARVGNADSGAVLLAALIYRFALFLSIPILYAFVRGWLWFEQRTEPPSRDTAHGSVDNGLGSEDV